MPRRKPDRPRLRERLAPTLGPRREPGPDGVDHLVRDIPGGRAEKTYRCPGCDHEIRPGTPHVVAWPERDTGGVEDRRHWHTGCWSGRATRRATRRRS